MRRLGGACALVLLSACGEDDAVSPQTIDTSLRDASLHVSMLDGGARSPTPLDAAHASNPCEPLDVCTDNEPSVLHNVCIAGSASGAVAQPACLVAPTGVLYLAPLTVGQLVTLKGWTQSTNATLSTADQARCEDARAKLLGDAATPPKCAGGK